VETENEILECGCERVCVNGRYILIPCDEHDEESHPPEPIYFTKFKRCIMDYA